MKYEYFSFQRFWKAMECCFVDVYVTPQISALRKLQQLDSNKSNIVLWYEHFNDRGNSCLVFEQLDKSLQTFMVERNWKPLLIKEIRPIVQQVCAIENIFKH